MPKSRNWRIAPAALLAAWLAQGPALAQGAAQAAASPATETDAQKSAFLAMPEEDRKAVQEALDWLGFYNGALDGAFGKRTRDAVLAYQASVKAPADGVVSAAQLAALKAATRKARAQVGFATIDERVSGARIGAPLKLFDKIAMVGGAVTLEQTPAGATLAFEYRSGADADLAALYAKLTADAKGRKVTYKAMKAGAFFVVAGERSDRRFYTRFAAAPAAWTGAPELRGFTFSYPSAQAADLDKVALAIANSFEPFTNSPASLAAATARAASSPTWKDIVRTASADPPPTPAASAPAAPAASALVATGLIVAPGQVLTAMRADGCANLVVAGKAAKTLRADAATGLALLGGDFGADGRAPRFGDGSSDLLVLSLAPGAAPGTTKLEVAAAQLAPAGAGATVVAALSRSASGAPAVDRKGGLAAIVAPIEREPPRFGAVAVAEPHAAVALAAIRSFLGATSDATPPAAGDPTAGEIAGAWRGAIVGIECRP